MHLQSSPKSLKRLRGGAYHFFLNIALALAAAVYFCRSALNDNEQGVYIGCGLGLLSFMSVVVFFLRFSSFRCPLCMSPVWGSRKCQKHKTIKPALGVSYRLGIALAVISKGRYRCQYCGEPFSAKRCRETGANRRSR